MPVYGHGSYASGTVSNRSGFVQRSDSRESAFFSGGNSDPIPGSAYADDFAREGTALGPNWDSVGPPVMTHSAGVVIGGSASSASRWTTDAPASGTLWAQVTWEGGRYSGPSVAMPTFTDGGTLSAAGTWYDLQPTFAGSNVIEIVQKDLGASSHTVIGTVSATPIFPGDVLRLEYDGTTLTGYINGVVVVTGTPATPITGQRGVGMHLGATTQNGLALMTDWSGGAMPVTTVTSSAGTTWGVSVIPGSGVTFSDDFNRADGALGSNWIRSATTTAPSIVGNQVVGNAGSQVARWVTDANTSGVMYSQATYRSGSYASVTVAMGTMTDGMGFTTTPTFYSFRSNQTGGALGTELRQKNAAASSYTVLATDTTTALNDGDVFRVEYDLSTSVLTCKINGSTVITYSPTTPITGQYGVGMGTGSATWTTALLDDWSGGTVSTPSTTITSVRSTLWDVLTSTQSARSTTWIVSGTVTGARSTTWAVRGTASNTRATSWNVLLATQSARGTTWTVQIIVTVANSRSTTWNVLAVTAVVRSTTWSTFAAISTARNTSWTARAVTQSARSTSWTVSGVVSGTRSTSWAVLTVLAGSRSTTWRVLAAVQALRTTIWGVGGIVAVARATTWTVSGTVSAVRVTTWAVLQTLNSSRATTWVARSLVGVPRSTTWAVGAPVTVARSTTWSLGGTVTGLRSTTWAVLTPTVSTRTTTWRVLLQTLKSQGTTWAVRGTVTVVRSAIWKVDGPVGSVRLTTWTVQQRVPDSMSTTWAVLIQTGAARATTWRTFAPTASSRATTWTARATLTGAISTAWAVLTATASTRDTTWITIGTHFFVGNSRDTTWTVRATVSDAQPTTWAVLRPTASARSTTWAVALGAVSSRSTTWRALSSSMSARTAIWSVQARVPTSRDTRWDVLRPLQGSVLARWAVLAFLLSDRDTEWATYGLVQVGREVIWTIQRDIRFDTEPPMERRLLVPHEDRTVAVLAENRTMIVPAERAAALILD